MNSLLKKFFFTALFVPLCGLTIVGQETNGEISLSLSLLSKTGQIKNKPLKVEDVEVFIHKKPQKIKSLVQQDEPVSVSILVDLSGSLDPRVLPFVVQTIGDFINKSNPKNEYSIVGFAKSPTVFLETTHDRIRTQQELNNLSVAKVYGNTAIYEALALGFEKMKKASYRKRALIVFSDGEDNTSKGVDADDIRNLCKQTDVLIYLIDMNNNVFRNPRLGTRMESLGTIAESLGKTGEIFFKDLARCSGGRRFYPTTNAELKESLETLTAELKNHSILTFIADNKLKGTKWQKIEIRKAKAMKKEHGDVVIKTRSGFYFQ